MGTDASGKYAVPNTYGVLFDDRSHHNTVGGTGPGEWNLISGNTAFGAYFYNNGTHSNIVVGNRIGTDASGMNAIANEAGVHIDGGTFDNTVTHNLISGNLVSGVTLFSIKTDRNVISRNRIGTSIDGAQALGNGADGIRIVFGPSDNQIGGTSEEGNVIAHNGRAGVMLESESTQRNRITGNQIYSNAGMRIDIFPEGFNAAHKLEIGRGPNGGIRSPIIESADLLGKICVVRGTISAANPASALVEVFITDTPAGQPAQGRTPLGRTKSDTNGRWMLRVQGVEAEARITATVTDSDGATSEFAQAFTVKTK